MLRLPPPLIGALLLLAGCASREPAPPPAPPPADASVPPSDSAPADPASLVGDSAAADTSTDSVLVGDPPTLVPGPLRRLPREWTTRTTDLAPPDAPAATLRDVRMARQDGFDRIVFDFERAVPGLHVEYVDRPTHACGSGHALYLDGEAWLRVTFQPAQAHTDAGEPTVTARRTRHSFPTLREAALTCDFEADVTWVLGLAAPNGYRLLELSDPPRLVVDLRH